MSKGLSDTQLALITESQVKTRMLFTFSFENNLLDIQLEDGSGLLLLETSDKLKIETEYIYLLENDTLTSLTIDDKIYLAGMIKRGTIESQLEGGKQKVSITMSNINQVYSNVLAEHGDILTNASCKIEEVIYQPPLHDELLLETGGTDGLLLEDGFSLIIENDHIIGDKINIFEGLVNNITVNESTFKFDIERILGGYSTQSPNSTYDVSCQFRFKDTRCQYSGSYTTCDKTLSSCQARNNSDRFGGYPSIPSELVIRG